MRPGCTVYPPTDIYFTDSTRINYDNTDDWFLCGQSCHNTSGCKAWKYYINTKQCHRYRSAAFNDKFSGDNFSNVYGGIGGCTLPQPTPTPTTAAPTPEPTAFPTREQRSGGEWKEQSDRYP